MNQSDFMVLNVTQEFSSRYIMWVPVIEVNFGLLEILIKRYRMAVKGNYYWRYTHVSLSPMILGGRLNHHQLVQDCVHQLRIFAFRHKGK